MNSAHKRARVCTVAKKKKKKEEKEKKRKTVVAWFLKRVTREIRTILDFLGDWLCKKELIILSPDNTITLGHLPLFDKQIQLDVYFDNAKRYQTMEHFLK